MGRPQADDSPTSYQEYDLQPQEYQYELTNVSTTQPPLDFSPPIPQIHYSDSTQQDPNDQNSQFTQINENDQQTQQQKMSQQPPQQQQMPPAAQYPPPPQANQHTQFLPQAYPPQGQQTAQFSSHSSNKTAAYPPQSVQFPPPSRANQPMAYPSPQPMAPSGNYHSQSFPPQQDYAPNAYQASLPQAVSFLPQNNAAQGYNMPPASPYMPEGHQQMAAQGIPVPTSAQNEGWKTGLFDCMEDPMNAVTTACFPCITFGQIAEIIDNGHTSCGTSGLLYGLIAAFIGIPCIMSCSYRTKLRAKYGLVEAPAPDWVTHLFCEWCSLCQEYRELRRRGLDPALGWQGNLMNQGMQQQPQAAMNMMPPINQKMMP